MPFDFGAALGAAKEQIGLFRQRDRAERMFDENDQYELQEGKNQPTPDLIRKLPDDNREANEQGGQYAGRLYYGENAADAFMDQRTGISKYLDPDMLVRNMPKRYTIAALACIGFIISVGMRTNLGVAKMGMLTNHSDIHWSYGGLVAAETSFLWGYAVTQIPGGFIAAKFPANKVFGLAIAISCALNILLPIAAHFSVVCFVFIRIIQGLLEGVTYPACHGIWRHWAPPIERSRLATLAFCGCYGGTVFGLALSGILADNFGWPTPFVVFGLLGLIWYFFWLWLSFEKPAKHPTITQQELIYIEESLGNVAQSYPTLATTPWKSIFTSMPVYAIIVANFCRSWTFYLLLFSQPKYFKDVFNESVQESGITGALPHLCMTIIVPFGGQLADHLRKSGKFTTTQVRKIFNCGGFGMEAFFLIVVSHATTKFGAVFSLILAVGSSGFAISGFNVNHLDIAPRYASILMGLSNGCGTFAGLICTILTQAMTKRGGAWSDVFIVAGCVHFSGVIFYAIFASGELQSWAEPPPDPDHVPAWKIRQMSIKHSRPPLASANEQLSGSLNGVQQPKYGATSDVQQTSFYGTIPESQEPPQSEYQPQRGYGYGDGREY